MPKNRKESSASESDSDSGPEDRKPAKKKVKQSNDKSSGSKEERHQWVLDGMKMATVREFKGKVFVDVREHYEKDGKLMPGKKGIALQPKQWKKLLELADEINAAIEEY